MTSGPTLARLLEGRVFDSETSAGVRYRVSQVIGEGGMGVAFYAMREGPSGATPAVLKVVKPEVMGTQGASARLMVQKEAIALGRINERIPPTPFVVRLLDTGAVRLPPSDTEVPWLALEYVHGGVEGTTLEQRVEYSIRHTRYAFDATRAADTIQRIGEGLVAIHEVGVVHRDLTLGNVLCCGFGATEVPKIADFGMARPVGIHATFGSVFLGTPGYAAPEQSFSSEGEVGPWTDVFSFACLVYFLLTGEQYFDSNNFAHALMMLRDPKRKSLLDAPTLSPELRDNPAVCRSIEQVLSQATALSPQARPPDAQVFVSSLVPLLRGVGSPRSQRASIRLVASIAPPELLVSSDEWTWTVRHPHDQRRLVRSLAWDGDGHCLAITTEGLYFWNGTHWLAAHADGAHTGVRCVSLVRPGLWLLSGDAGRLALVGAGGTPRIIQGPAEVDLSFFSGDPDDLAVAIGQHDARPAIYSIAARRFFRPTVLEGVRTVTSLARVDELRWLIAGRSVSGGGYAALYGALDFELTPLLAPPTDAFTTAAGHVDRGVGVVAGRRGATVRVDGPRTTAIAIDGAPDIASVAVDVQGVAWAGAAGRLWNHHPQGRWNPVWSDSTWNTPFVSIRADVGVVTAVTVDGGVLEGRMA